MMLTVAMAMLFSVVAMAANQTYCASYSGSGAKHDSAANAKPNDGDNRLYVTTLSQNGDSTVFPGGTLYARARLVTNPNGVYSPLISFTSNTNKNAAYGAGMAKYGQQYFLRTEVSGCRSYPAKQWIRWCP